MRSGWIRLADSSSGLRPDPWTVSTATDVPDIDRVSSPRRGRRWKRSRWPKIAGIGAVAVASGAAGAFAVHVFDDRPFQRGEVVTVLGDSSQVENVDGGTSNIAAEILPSVVSVDVGNVSGSGFVIAKDGFVLTNNHVIASVGDTSTVSLVLHDGRETEASVVGRSPSYDLAVLEIDVDDLQPVTFGQSDGVRVGDAVIAIGSPLGLDGTVTSGIVSARDRPVSAGNGNQQSYINALQTDAAINPGNSGGPLVDVLGRVIGVNSAIATLEPGNEIGNIGLGFAIPIDQAIRTAEQIIATGEARYPIMGVILDNAFDGPGAQIAEDSDEAPGVSPDGPADQAGIVAGDIIVQVDDEKIDDSRELVVILRSHEPGDEVAVVIERDGEQREFVITLDSAIG